MSESQPGNTENHTRFRAGYVAVLGLPNVGKSTLLNSLVQEKLSIVTPKPQTTRKRVNGILNGEGYQIIFMDTPGILKPKYSLQEMMMRYVRSAIQDADVLVYLVDAEQPRQTPGEVGKLFAEVDKPVILALNKIDLIDKGQLLPMMEAFSTQYSYQAMIPVSAMKGDGLPELIDKIVSLLPFSPPYYPTDYISDQQERFFAAEIIREKIFKFFQQEIPYSTHVEIEEFIERENQKDYIRAVIMIDRPSQKGILIGKQGKALKKIGALARMDIEQFLGRDVFLELFVKVVPDWRRKENLLKRLGY